MQMPKLEIQTAGKPPNCKEFADLVHALDQSVFFSMQRTAAMRWRGVLGASRRVSCAARLTTAAAAESQGSTSAMDVAVYGAGAAVVGYSGYNLYELYTEFPEGCQVSGCGNCTTHFVHQIVL